eukprot:scaffold21440_cov146-Isochrysis_galbana.AAC.3
MGGLGGVAGRAKGPCGCRGPRGHPRCRAHASDPHRNHSPIVPRVRQPSRSRRRMLNAPYRSRPLHLFVSLLLQLYL